MQSGIDVISSLISDSQVFQVHDRFCYVLVVDGEKYELRNDNDLIHGNLVIKNAQYHHSGNYTCVAKTDTEEKTKHIQLLVQCKLYLNFHESLSFVFRYFPQETVSVYHRTYINFCQ